MDVVRPLGKLTRRWWGSKAGRCKQTLVDEQVYPTFLCMAKTVKVGIGVSCCCVSVVHLCAESVNSSLLFNGTIASKCNNTLPDIPEAVVLEYSISSFVSSYLSCNRDLHESRRRLFSLRNEERQLPVPD